MKKKKTGSEKKNPRKNNAAIEQYAAAKNDTERLDLIAEAVGLK